jgi:hypothetical protein
MGDETVLRNDRFGRESMYFLPAVVCIEIKNAPPLLDAASLQMATATSDRAFSFNLSKSCG